MFHPMNIKLEIRLREVKQVTFPLERQLIKAAQWTESNPSPEITT